MKGYRVRRRHELPLLSFAGARMHGFLTTADTDRLSVYDITLSAGQSVPPAYHKKAVELIWILRGAVTISLGRSRVRLGRGDSLFIRPPTPHGFRAGSAGLRMLAILTPHVDSRTDIYPVHKGSHGHTVVLRGRWSEGRRRG